MHLNNHLLVPHEGVESCHLEEEYIEELEKENRVLSAFNEDLLAQNQELTHKICDLAHQMNFLSQKNDRAGQEQGELKGQLAHLMAEQHNIVATQEALDEAHAVLTTNVDLLCEEKKELMIRCDQTTAHVEGIKEQANDLLTVSHTHLLEQKRLQEELDLLQNTNRQLLSYLDDLKARKRREESANKLDELGGIGAGVAFGCGALLGCAIVPGVIVGGSVYAIYQLSKQYIKSNVAHRMNAYMIDHPGATKNEALDQIFRKNRQKSVIL